MNNFIKINYNQLNSKQKENYNFHKVASALADYGFNSMRLNDDWQGADFIAVHKDGDIMLKVQLKGRFCIDEKYLGKDIWIAFIENELVKIYKHDDAVVNLNDKVKYSKSWINEGSYSWNKTPVRYNNIISILNNDLISDTNSEQILGSVKKGALLSDCKVYRYRLWRIWDEAKPKVMFIMLNPSTADGEMDDPTVRRCIGFAKSWGYGGLYIANLFAYRSTQPKDLLEHTDVVGLDNSFHLNEMSKKCEIAVCAWGNSKIVNKLKFNKQLLKGLKIPLYCIELSKDGTPKHPLYLKSELKPIKFLI